jgi:hypothetical protein
MSGFFIGITIGTFLGISITTLYLVLEQNRSPVHAEIWIDEALEKAIRAIERKY